jgi:hypothetical protein
MAFITHEACIALDELRVVVLVNGGVLNLEFPSTRLLPPGGRLIRSLEDGSRVKKDTQKIRE